MTIRKQVVRALTKKVAKAAHGLPSSLKLTVADYQFGKRLTKAVGVDPESSGGAMSLFLMFAAKRAHFVAHAREHPDFYKAGNEGQSEEFRGLESTALQSLDSFVKAVMNNKGFFKAIAFQYDKRMI